MQGTYLIAVVGADNKVTIRPVQTGERFGEQWIVRGDLKVGDRVVAEGIQKVRDGIEVNPVPAGTPAAEALKPKPEPKQP
jgi:membrane fusion protein (multidrug efflux system)